MIPDPFVQHRAGADPLIAGYYLLQLANRAALPVRVWFGPPLDPETGEELERAHRWQIQIGFQLLEDAPMRIGEIWFNDITDVWPVAAKVEIDEAEWRFRLERAEWASSYDPNDAMGNLGRRFDPMTVTLA
jgi:hypothetical protein